MSKYDIFEKIIQAYKTNNDAALYFNTMLLLENETENPYKLGYKEYELFSTMPIYYKKSKSKTVGQKNALANIKNNMKQILEISTMNPYSEGNFFKKEISEKGAKTERSEESAIVQLEEPEHILGVIPNQEIDDYTVQVTETPEEKTEKAVLKPEPKQEPEPAPKKIFSRHKKR